MKEHLTPEELRIWDDGYAAGVREFKSVWAWVLGAATFVVGLYSGVAIAV